MGIHPRWDTSPFTPWDNLVQPINLVECFLEVGRNWRNQRNPTWTEGGGAKLWPDSNPSSWWNPRLVRYQCEPFSFFIIFTKYPNNSGTDCTYIHKPFHSDLFFDSKDLFFFFKWNVFTRTVSAVLVLAYSHISVFDYRHDEA